LTYEYYIREHMMYMTIIKHNTGQYHESIIEIQSDSQHAQKRRRLLLIIVTSLCVHLVCMMAHSCNTLKAVFDKY